MRANMTDAQLEERRKYQRERYHKLKQKEQLSNVVEMKKIA
jgi:hypothetical protein